MELIELLEKATGPAFALDMAIARAVNPQATAQTVPPPYSASIDAALTLVPERAIRHIEWCEGFVEVAVFTERHSLAHGAAATPALAICIAALRAKDTTHD
jgi:hypothetical protein